jgi:hypothetical protein
LLLSWDFESGFESLLGQTHVLPNLAYAATSVLIRLLREELEP